ncbi:hypothetical protein I4U23_027506 [Adineta vaga]|nr:hypothetical protein I4U23_027506 [Adineta vaga]
MQRYDDNLYRGQVISSEEDREPFVNHSLLSTTLDKDIALIFLDSCTNSDELIRILFEIEINFNEQSIPFADISKLRIKFLKTGNIYELIKNINNLIDIYEKKIKLEDKYKQISSCFTYNNTLYVYQQTIQWCLNEKEIDLFYIADIYDRVASIFIYHRKDRNLALQYELLRHRCILELFTLEGICTTRSKQNRIKKIIESHLKVANVAEKFSDYDLVKEHLHTALIKQLELKEIGGQLRDFHKELDL